jgi:glycosyltransferase involved in cell wall biosynthesis
MNILIVTYYFPPADFGSTNRLIRLLPELSGAGMKFTALTVNRKDIRANTDPSLLGVLQYFEGIERTTSFEPFRSWDTYNARHKKTEVQVDERGETPAARKRGSLWLRFIRPFAGFFRKLSSIPDGGIGWYPFAVRRALRICRRQHFDLILSTTPSHAAHLVAHSVSRRTRIPWVADFRDAWFEYGREYGRWERNIMRKLLNRIIKGSAALTFTSQGMHEVICKEYPNERQKCHFVPHGVTDLATYPTMQKPTGEFWLSFVGSLDRLRDPNPLLRVLEVLKLQDLSAYGRIRVKVIGTVADDIRENILRSRVSDKFDLVGFVPRDESVRFMQSSDALLILLADMSGIGYGASASKVYDYLAAKKPILAIVPEGSVSRLIRETTSGGTFTPTQTKECGSWLVRVMNGSERYQPDKLVIESLHVHGIAERLRVLFNELLTNGVS